MVNIYLTNGQKEMILIYSIICNISFFIGKPLFITMFIMTFGFLIIYFITNALDENEKHK